MGGRRLATRYWKEGLLVAIVLALVETFSCAAGRIVAARGFLYRPDSAEGFDEYLARRDSLLGWPSPETFGKGELDPRGARIVPAFPDPSTPSCVEVFGDSFSFGDEVGPEDSYPNALARRLGCRVANYGVGGYGTDQAYLRWRERASERAPVVVLGHFAENIIRNVNRFRGFLSPSRFGLKPRFLAGADGALELLPMPEVDAAQYAALWRHPELLPHEYFMPGGAAGIAVLRFPYLLSVPRALGHYRLRALGDDAPSYEPFYRRDHASGAFEVTLGILTSFAREAAERGQRPVIALIPDEKDLIALRARGRTSYAPLESALRDAGIETPPIAASMVAALGGREPCALYVRCGGAHFNPEGYGELARSIGDWIDAHGGVARSAP